MSRLHEIKVIAWSWYLDLSIYIYINIYTRCVLVFNVIYNTLMYLRFFCTFLGIHGGLQFTVVGINLFNFIQLVPVCCSELHFPLHTLSGSVFLCMSAHDKANYSSKLLSCYNNNWMHCWPCFCATVGCSQITHKHTHLSPFRTKDSSLKSMGTTSSVSTDRTVFINTRNKNIFKVALINTFHVFVFQSTVNLHSGEPEKVLIQEWKWKVDRNRTNANSLQELQYINWL